MYIYQQVHGTCLYNIHTYVHVPTGTWYMPEQHLHIYMYQQVHGTCLYNIYTYVHVPIGAWYMPVKHIHICTCTNRCMVHACTTYTHMYMYRGFVLKIACACTIPLRTMRPLKIDCEHDCPDSSYDFEQGCTFFFPVGLNTRWGLKTPGYLKFLFVKVMGGGVELSYITLNMIINSPILDQY